MLDREWARLDTALSLALFHGALDADWKENEHPRKPDGEGGGQFTKGSGGGARRGEPPDNANTDAAWTAANATPHQTQAIRMYTHTGYRFINSGLRTGRELTGLESEIVRDLDHITKNADYDGEKDGALSRGVSVEIMKKFAAAGLLKPGAVFADPGFASFTRRPEFARAWSKSQILSWRKGAVMVCKRGGRGFADIAPLSSNQSEYEVLLQRGRKLRTTSWDPKTRTLEVELLGDDGDAAPPQAKDALGLDEAVELQKKKPRASLDERMGDDDWAGVQVYASDGKPQGTL